MQGFSRIALLSLVPLLTLAGTALADGPVGGGINPGVQIGLWIQHNVAGLFAPILGAVALYYLVRRQFTRFLSFSAFAVLVALFVFAGDAIKDAAISLGRWVIGG